MKKVLRYLASTDGRTVKFIGGALISAAGLFVSPLLVVIGLLPLLASVFDFCVIAPFFKLPLEGEKLRDTLKEK